MKILRFLGVVSIIFILGACGCINTQKIEGSHTETLNTLKVIDLYNREVEVPEKVERIVCCGPG
ncbi:MAG TPA: ABC transporter substrate-binding protein, partial [Methanothermococcus okinawensis]|nr:ABC transporter substrate-binding protein [Methanothermococcus okinawensis]